MNGPAAHIAQHKWQPNTPDGQSTPFIFHHAKEASTGVTLIRMFKGDSEYPQAQAYGSSGIRSSSVTAITGDGEIITGKHVFKGCDLSCDGLVINKIEIHSNSNKYVFFRNCNIYVCMTKLTQ